MFFWGGSKSIDHGKCGPFVKPRLPIIQQIKYISYDLRASIEMTLQNGQKLKWNCKPLDEWFHCKILDISFVYFCLGFSQMGVQVLYEHLLFEKIYMNFCIVFFKITLEIFKCHHYQYNIFKVLDHVIFAL